MSIPQSLVSGDTWTWSESLADYPAPTWLLTTYFRGPTTFNVVATASGSDHSITVSAADTATYKPGRYSWSARVSSLGVVRSVDSGLLSVEPNLADTATDPRSFWQQVLDELEPVILNRAGSDQLSMSIAGRSLSRMTWDELLKVYDRALLEVASEDGDSPVGRVYYRYGSPS